MKTRASIFRFIVLGIILLSCIQVYGSIAIDSVNTTPSRCANDGSITIYGISNTAMIYAIISGPDIRIPQSGNQFSALSSGTYQVRVTNFSNDTVLVIAIVGGHYAAPDFAPTFSRPLCRGAATGMIIGHGLSYSIRPYTWSLTNTGTGAVVTQSSDTFRNLVPGNYSLKMFDSCQSFATRAVTIQDAAPGVSLSFVTPTIISCDSTLLTLSVHPPGNSNKDSLFAVRVHHGSENDFFSEYLDQSIYLPQLLVRVPRCGYGDSISVIITDQCGVTDSMQLIIQPFDQPYPFSINATDSCIIKTQIIFQSTFNTFYHGFITGSWVLGSLLSCTIVVKDSATGLTVDSEVVAIGGDIHLKPVPSGPVYFITISDTCGNVIRDTFITPSIPPPSISYTLDDFTCLDSTADITVSMINFFSGTSLTIVSGPPLMSSSKPPFAYNHPLSYPVSFPTTNVGSFSLSRVGSLPAGVYRILVTDSCGNTILDSFTIRPSDVTDYKYNVGYIRGCPGENRLNYSVSNAHPGASVAVSIRSASLITPYYNYASISQYSDTLYNLNYGTYYLSFDFAGNGEVLDSSQHCITVYDTIYIPPYQTPRIDYAIQVRCNGTVNVGLQPDSTKGVAPYSYEIISGPQTSSVQPSNFFALTQPGQYVVRISDTCGFAGTFSFAVDTLRLLRVIKTGSSCLGNSTVLVADHTPYYTYIWQRPNGSSYIGDSLSVGPVSAGDYGLYHIRRVTHIGTCIDTTYGTYTLDPNSVSYATVSICPGQSYTFAGHTQTLAGIYSDTIHSAVCDSIAYLTLSFAAPTYVSAAEIICSGESVTVGSHIYRSSGIYTDTFARASGCDSIYTLNLTVLPTYLDTVSAHLCNGEVLWVGPHAYNATGTYRDTLRSILGCDSIVVSRIISEDHRHSYFFSLCTGDSAVVGDSVYRASTFYRYMTPLPGGCDSQTTVLVTVGPVKYANVYQYKCPGHNFYYRGHTYTSAGLYPLDTIHRSIGCDSITSLYLYDRNYILDSAVRNICTGQSVAVGTHIYTSTGIFRDTFSTIGCDSIHILLLTVGGAKHDSISQSICFGQSITVGPHTYNTTGVYRDTFGTTGCDSIHILNLQVGNSKRDSIFQSICMGQSVSIGSHIYNVTGIYRDTFATIGCDSVHVLNLQVGSYKRDSVSLSICEGQSIMIGSHIYGSTGLYRDTFATIFCDSIHILNLIVVAHRRDSITQTICPGQLVLIGSQTYTAAGIYCDTFTTSSGCDSIRVLTLLAGGVRRDTVDVSFCEGKSITIDGNTYLQSGLYSDTIGTTGCDSIHTVRVTVLPIPYPQITASDSEVKQGDTVQLSVNGSPSQSYYWTSSAVLSAVHSQNPTAIINQSAWITIQTTDTNNCSATDSIFIKLGECDGAIFIPNAFTPNGDGKNDMYRVFARCAELNSLEIFNRWGEKVWETEDINQGWDGTYRGAVQPTEVYVYLISYRLLSDKSGVSKHKQGSITLIR